MDLSNPLHLIAAIVAALGVAALLVLLIVFLFKPSAGRDRLRLAFLSLLGRRDRKNHVFLGISSSSRLMARSILAEWKAEKKKKDQGRILFVDLTGTFQPTLERNLREELGSHRISVFCGHLPQEREARLADALGLPGLQVWLANKRTSLYLVSEKSKENSLLLSAATDDTSIKAKIFCYESRPDGFDTLVASTASRVRMLNPHQMTFTNLKLHAPALMPVHYVQKEPQGYVKQGLHALIVGFGSIGQEAARFLYEYGSFVGKDYGRALMSIQVFDPRLDFILGQFLESAPGLKGDDAFQWHREPASSVAFWEAFEQDPLINYVVVAVDEGPQNIQLGVSLLQAAARSGRDLSHMLIMVRDWDGSKKTQHILDFYNAAYCPEGCKVLQRFGMAKDIWDTDVISGKRLKKAAKDLSKEESWEERKERLSQAGPDQLKNRLELHRRQSEEIFGVLYAPTLHALAPEGEYLAAQEHLHWMNALIVMGYTNGPQNELLKRLPNLIPYPDLKK